MKLKSIITEKPLTASVVFYFITVFLLLPAYIHLVNPDGIAYITISRKYLHGDFHNAVNGYWGPLFSWLMIPFLSIGLPGYFSARIVLILTGVAAIFAVDSLVKSARLSHDIRPLALNLSVPLILTCVYWNLTPDLLLTTVLLFYFSSIINVKYTEKKYYGVTAGILGAFAYFSKSYGLPFFLSHFVIYNVYLFFAQHRKWKVQTLNFITGLLCFLLLSSLWASALSYKYGKIVWNTSATINHAIYGPGVNGKHRPVEGINAPVNQSAINVWEDPSNLEYHDWSPFASKELFAYQINTILYNIYEVVKFSFAFAPLFLPLLFVTWKRIKEKEFFTVALFSSLLYSAGYLLLAVETRYIWFIYFIILILSTAMFSAYIKDKNYGRVRRNIITALFILSFIPYMLFALSINFFQGERVYKMSNQVSRYIKAGDSIVSDVEYIPSLYISFYSDARYYGEADFEKKDTAEKMIRSYRIKYFLLWDSGNIARYPYLKYNSDLVCNVGEKGKLYRLKYSDITPE